MCRSQIADIVVRESERKELSSRLLLKKQKRRAMEMMRIAEKHESTEPPPSVSNEALNTDLLAVSTAYYRTFIEAGSEFINKWKDTKAFRIMFQTTQPAHIITIVAVSVVASLLCSRSSNASNSVTPSALTNLVYLGAFMTHFGAQMWMTFVSGLALYFEIPRHTFGIVQKVLFPKYFSLNSILSMVTLFLFVKLHPRSEWDNSVGFQIFVMSVCFLLELVIRLYLTPPLLRLMTAKTAIEKAAGVGLEVGKHNPGPLAQCPHYVKMHQAFRKIHMAVAIGNILTMACTTVHLHYLANKICFL